MNVRNEMSIKTHSKRSSLGPLARFMLGPLTFVMLKIDKNESSFKVPSNIITPFEAFLVSSLLAMTMTFLKIYFDIISGSTHNKLQSTLKHRKNELESNTKSRGFGKRHGDELIKFILGHVCRKCHGRKLQIDSTHEIFGTNFG